MRGTDKMKRNIIKVIAILSLGAVMVLGGCSKTTDTTSTDKTSTDTASSDNETKNNEESDDKSGTEADAEYQAYLDNLATQGTEITQLDPPAVGEEIAVIHTSMGDIKVKFFENEAPKAVENFKTHAKEGYYDGIIFHRVINDFMIQSGSPDGTGSGGESIYGSAFEDEFSPNLYNFRGALCMANSGMNTNQSQFFVVQKPEVQEGYFDYIDQIVEKYGTDQVLYNSENQTMVRVNYSEQARELYNEYGGTPHLDYVHTVFGQVFDGMDVVDAIAAVETDENDKPVNDVVINSITFENYK